VGGVSEHVKRGMEIQRGRPVKYEWEGIDDGNINSVWHCTECGDKLELRSRRGEDAYVEVGCGCGLVSLQLRIGGVIGLDIDEWESVTAQKLGRE
jgi:hypothetical protein